MVPTLIVVFLILWLLGIATSYTLGGFINVLAVAAIVVFLLGVVKARNPLRGW